MKHILLLCLSIEIALATASASSPLEDLFRQAYSKPDKALQARIETEKLDEAQRTILLIQALSASEIPNDQARAMSLSDSFLQRTKNSWAHDFVLIQKSLLLTATGHQKEGAALMTTALETIDFDRLAQENDPLLQLIRSKYSFGGVPFQTYLRDSLREQLAFLYIDMPSDQGGPDLARANRIAETIETNSVKISVLKQAKSRQKHDGPNPAATKKSQ